jgi:hypothetical protein
VGAAGQPTPDSRRRLPRATAVAYEPILVPAAYGHYVETFAEVLPTLTAFLLGRSRRQRWLRPGAGRPVKTHTKRRREMYKLKRLWLASAGSAALLGSLLIASSAFAGQPVTRTLNPPPPAWWTCMAAGNGTTCTGTASYSYGPDDTGIACGSGADAFDILDSATVTDRLTARYDADGDLAEIVKHETYSSARFTNPLTGATLPYTSHVNTTNTFVGSGVLGVSSGETNFTAPGLGAVALNAGRLIDFFNGDDSILFDAGPHSLFPDLYLYGDTSVVQRLCAALGATV